jgi:exonuclease VII small subunit
MSEGEETKWRLGTEPEEAEERAAELTSQENETKDELQHTIQTKVEEIGGGGEGSLITRPEEVPITEVPRKKEQVEKANRPNTKKEQDSSKNMEKISKELERHANRLTRIEKVILPLERSVNKIDKQSNTIKQLHTKVTQLQKQIRSTKNRAAQKKGKNLVSRSKRRSLKRRLSS